MFALVADTTSAGSGGAAIFGLIGLAVAIFYLAAVWKIFTKAGRSGWLSIIPIVKTIVLIQIAGKSGWWVLLLFIPVVDVVVYILLMLELAKAFGYGAGFALGLIFLSFIFVPILGFGSARYQLRPAAQPYYGYQVP